MERAAAVAAMNNLRWSAPSDWRTAYVKVSDNVITLCLECDDDTESTTRSNRTIYGVWSNTGKSYTQLLTMVKSELVNGKFHSSAYRIEDTMTYQDLFLMDTDELIEDGLMHKRLVLLVREE